MARTLGEGKGAICITHHLGNWEMGGLLLAFRGGTLNALSLDESTYKDIEASKAD